MNLTLHANFLPPTPPNYFLTFRYRYLDALPGLCRYLSGGPRGGAYRYKSIGAPPLDVIAADPNGMVTLARQSGCFRPSHRSTCGTNPQ
jgi:hypothetical protein